MGRRKDEGGGFEAIFNSEFDYVCHTLSRFGVSDGDIDDVAQTVFLAVHRRLSDYDPSRPIRPWLVAFAHRAASNYRRGVRRRGEGCELSEAHKGDDGRQQVERLGERKSIEEVLAAVEPDRRTILIMFDVDGYTAAEIAESLALPLNTVYSRLRLARRDFRALGAHHFQSEVKHEQT